MLTLKAPWVVWILAALVVYMAFKAPATLSAVTGELLHFLGLLAGAAAHFLAMIVKPS